MSLEVRWIQLDDRLRRRTLPMEQLRQDGFEVLAQNFQPRDFRAPQIGEDARLAALSILARRRATDRLVTRCSRFGGAARGEGANSAPGVSGFPLTAPAPIRLGSGGEPPSRPVSSMSAILPLHLKNARVYAFLTIDASEILRRGASACPPPLAAESTFRRHRQ